MAVSIDFSLLHKLERFRIVPRGTYRGGTIGNRRSTSRGTGLEFADHKGYSAGDDIRYLDWNVYGRLEELFIKKFEISKSNSSSISQASSLWISNMKGLSPMR